MSSIEVVEQLDPELEEALFIEAIQMQQFADCHKSPLVLAEFVEATDRTSGEKFKFHLNEPAHPWFYQREVIDLWMRSQRSIILKARQLGVTWVAAEYALWHLLFKPGTDVLILSKTEKDAQAVLTRIWDMYWSLPEHLRNHVTIEKPDVSRTTTPTEEFTVRHKNNQTSKIIAMVSTARAARSYSAAIIIIDEAAFTDELRGIWSAAYPATQGGKGGKIILISTANGLSNPTTGEGNYFHRLWTTHKEKSIERMFFGIYTHPDWDETRYELEAAALDSPEREMEYPRTAREAFAFTAGTYYNAETLEWYDQNGIREPKKTGEFITGREPNTATFEPMKEGIIDIYDLPRPGFTYAIAADSSTGRGADYSSAFVINLTNMEIAAELHSKITADRFAFQLHYLGRWFNDAIIAPETQGGYGEALILFLRDGKDGRPPYPFLYQHRDLNRAGATISSKYGIPTTPKWRPIYLDMLGKALRAHDLPYITEGTLEELQTFIHHVTGTSPRAMKGANDDRVMALAIGCYLYSQYATHPKPVKSARDAYGGRADSYAIPEKLYPWQE